MEVQRQMFKISEINTNEKYREYVLSILNNFNQEIGEKKIYVGGSFEENQSKFEKQSNQGIIGVIGSSKEEGNLLLNFLRAIMEDNYDYLLPVIYDDDDNEISVSTNFIIQVLSTDIEECNTVHPMNEISKFELQNSCDIIVNPKKMNLWDINRIKEYITEVEDFELEVF